ncbi:MAG TPA: heme-binding protein, partial [Methylomirabilota bacterium]|nr:heme-binding protein [Methylomirabilota bacterium]
MAASTNVTRVGEREVRLTLQPGPDSWLPIEVLLATGNGEPRLDVSWFTAEDTRRRPLPLRRVLLPWAKPYLAVTLANHTPELEGGDWERGRKIYFGEQAACFKCHQIGG